MQGVGSASVSGGRPAFVELPALLDLAAAQPLRAELLALRGRPLVIEASSVTRLGGLCLQVLMSARQTWRRDGIAFGLSGTSRAMTDQLNAFGELSLVVDG